MKRIFITKQQIDEISSWEQSNPIPTAGGANKVSLQGYMGRDDDSSYDVGDPITTDEIGRELTADFFKQFGMQQGRNFAPNGLRESYDDSFLNKKFKASETSKEKMTIQNTNGFVDNYINGDTSLKALRQKVYNMEHGRSSEDPETQKQIMLAYNNAKKVNSTNQDAKKETKLPVVNKTSSTEKDKNEKIITYFN